MTFTACSEGHAPIEDRIHAAEAAIDSGNYSSGQEICKTLVSDSADRDIDREANMVLASRILGLATAQNADSVREFVSSLPYEQQAPVATALTIPANPGDRPTTFPDEELGDILSDSLHSHNHTH